MNPIERALSAVIDEALAHIETLGCTCATAEQRNDGYLVKRGKSGFVRTAKEYVV